MFDEVRVSLIHTRVIFQGDRSSYITVRDFNPFATADLASWPFLLNRSLCYKYTVHMQAVLYRFCVCEPSSSWSSSSSWISDGRAVAIVFFFLLLPSEAALNTASPEDPRLCGELAVNFAGGVGTLPNALSNGRRHLRGTVRRRG